ncbi:MAG: ABC transporter ATP-binding protein [Clostridia bacterium]|nr:ABC transporter ATP-binding protein [Clostridia bacterium]
MTDRVILEVKDLCKHFAVKGKGVLRAVDHVSLQLHEGETLGLVGESGCGKTTLGRTIVKIYRPDAGQVLYEGRDIWQQKGRADLEYHKNVQMIFQDPYASLDPLSVISTSIGEGLDIHGMYKGKARHDRILELLQMVGLNKEHANRFPHEFSGGQRQRIGIARALAVEPRVIVCDEPISALDVSIQAQVMNLLVRLQDEMKLSYLFITHDLSMVRAISNRIAVMYLGSIVELADADTLYTHHLHPYTSALLSAIPIPDPDVEEKRSRMILSGDLPSPIGLGAGCPFASRCPRAKDVCRQSRPMLTEMEKGHFVACHRAKEG